jgi:CheY-like chemotaxis protein
VLVTADGGLRVLLNPLPDFASGVRVIAQAAACVISRPGFASAGARSQNAPVLPDLRGVSVLVVEDERIMRRLFRAWFEQLGASVREASDGRVGLELIGTFRPDVVLCDLSMPSFDGYDFIKGLRQDLKLQTPVIAVTGMGDSEALLQTAEAGFAAFLLKPVTLEQVAAQVARVLGR